MGTKRRSQGHCPKADHLDLTVERVLALWDLGGAGGSSLTSDLRWPEPCAALGAAGRLARRADGSTRRGGAEAWNSCGLVTAGFAAVLSFNLPHVGAKK